MQNRTKSVSIVKFTTEIETKIKNDTKMLSKFFRIVLFTFQLNQLQLFI